LYSFLSLSESPFLLALRLLGPMLIGICVPGPTEDVMVDAAAAAAAAAEAVVTIGSAGLLAG
jgi:hypothetical protein